MKRTTLLSFLILLLPLSGCWAQGSVFTDLGNDLKRADKLYERLAFAPAVDLYQKALGRARQNKDNIKVKLARCYYQLNQPDQAAYWYEQILAKDSLFTEKDRFQFAQSLSGDQQYARAKEQYQALGQLAIAQEMISGLNDMDQFYKDSSYYQVRPLSVNTEAAEFSPAFYEEGLIFASSRSHRSPVQRTFRWDQTPFLDLYYAPLDSTGRAGKPKSLKGAINTRFHEGTLVLLDSGKRMVFTRNNYSDGQKGLSSERVNKLKLYQAERDRGDSWTNITPLPFNSEEYSSGHPAISPDGKTLYFVSDIPGGVGGTDLYTSEYDNGQWSAPRNLGSPVNTMADEMFPFVAADGTLYFASEGHAGLGGLDIFRMMPNEEPQNMGYPINTHRDDFGLIVNETGDTGYFSSNRLRGGADDDLYQASINRPRTLLVQGHAVDRKTRESLADATVELKDEQGNVLDQTLTDDEGNYSFEVQRGARYTAVASRDDYQPDEKPVDATRLTTSILEVENTLPKNRLIVWGRVIDRKTGNIVDSTIVSLINRATGETEQELLVDQGGAYRFDLKPDQRYEIRAGRQTYLGAIDSVRTEGIKNESFTKDLVLNKVTLNQAINLDNIYYDFDKWDIRPNAAQELNKLVEFMQQNPTVEVELGSHTDARGDKAYNESLSQKRSESAVDYIVSKGIPRNRITARGFGETQIINGCMDNVPCSVFQHQKNRRTEFTVVRE